MIYAKLLCPFYLLKELRCGTSVIVCFDNPHPAANFERSLRVCPPSAYANLYHETLPV